MEQMVTVYLLGKEYSVPATLTIMDAMEYGNIPQHRSRIFIVAFLDYQKCEKFEFPEQIKRTVFLNDILKRNTKNYLILNLCMVFLSVI